MTVLVMIGHDASTYRRVARALKGEGHRVVCAATLGRGLSAVIRHQPGFILLDASATGLAMLGVLRQTRGKPSVVVTGDEYTAIAFLEGGADAYVVSPLSVRVLKAQLRAIERRKTRCLTTTVTVGDLRLDLAGRTAVMRETSLELSAREFDLLAILALHEGRFVSREKLLAMIWRRPSGGADKSLQFYLGVLRRKLGETASCPRYLHATRSVGIKLVDPTTARLPPRRSARGPASTFADGASNDRLVAAYG